MYVYLAECFLLYSCAHRVQEALLRIRSVSISMPSMNYKKKDFLPQMIYRNISTRPTMANMVKYICYTFISTVVLAYQRPYIYWGIVLPKTLFISRGCPPKGFGLQKTYFYQGLAYKGPYLYQRPYLYSGVGLQNTLFLPGGGLPKTLFRSNGWLTEDLISTRVGLLKTLFLPGIPLQRPYFLRQELAYKKLISTEGVAY